jgi:phage tail sheath protein FI
MKGDIKMPEYLAPGVYVEEVDTGGKPIEGVSTTTTAMVGATKRGPVDGLPPTLVTSFADFRRKFGSYLGEEFQDRRYFAYAVEGFFQNGGRKVYIKRVPGRGSNFFAAAKTMKGGIIARLADDPLTDKETAIPPSGHMAGIYARSDIEKGVYKAPANEEIRGIMGLKLTINKLEQDILNPPYESDNRSERFEKKWARISSPGCSLHHQRS